MTQGNETTLGLCTYYYLLRRNIITRYTDINELVVTHFAYVNGCFSYCCVATHHAQQLNGAQVIKQPAVTQ
jgi:hypothetical protein